MAGKVNDLTQLGDFVYKKDVSDVGEAVKQIKEKIFKYAEENGYKVFEETAQRVILDETIGYKVWTIKKEKLK